MIKEAMKNNTEVNQVLERFQHVSADGETVYVIDASPAYQKLYVPDSVNSSCLRLNPFTGLSAKDARDIEQSITSDLNGVN